MASTRLFHAIVMVGSALAVSCGASTTEPSGDAALDGSSDGAGDGKLDSTTDTADTFPGISPAEVGPDTFPTIAIDTSGFDIGPKDTSAGDTFPGISPADIGADTFPGISPPPPPDA